jgi:hypothetical protein
VSEVLHHLAASPGVDCWALLLRFDSQLAHHVKQQGYVKAGQDEPSPLAVAICTAAHKLAHKGRLKPYKLGWSSSAWHTWHAMHDA